MSRRRVGTISDLRDELGLPDGAAAWEFLLSDPPGYSYDKADGDGKPWVVWCDD